MNLQNGTLYYVDGESMHEIGEVSECECVESTYADESQPTIKLIEPGEITGTITGVNYLYANYPNRRVVYLAFNSKKRRTRKKNLYRMIKIIDRLLR